MSRLGSTLLAGLFVAGVLAMAAPDLARPAKRGLQICAAAEVVDGDTLRCAGTPRIRLLGIDTPDHSSSAPCRGHFGNHVCDDALADAATALLRKRIDGQRVSILKVTTDRYGRWVAEAFANGADLSCYQLRTGFARYIPSYDTGLVIARRCPGIVRKAAR